MSNRSSDEELESEWRRGEKAGSKCAGCFLVCGFCRILCYKGCRASFPCCFKKPPVAKPEYTIICVGLSGSGKSTLLGLLAGEVLPATLDPTMGFAMKTISNSEAIFHVKELGGADSIRQYWNRYYSGHEALMFIIDSSSNGSEESDTLKACIKDPSLSHVPILVVCNKMDLADAKKPEEWTKDLDIDELCKGRYYQVVGSSRDQLWECQEALDGLARELQHGLPRRFESS